MSVEVHDPSSNEAEQLVTELRRQGFGADDISGNEMAKSHARLWYTML